MASAARSTACRSTGVARVGEPEQETSALDFGDVIEGGAVDAALAGSWDTLAAKDQPIRRKKTREGYKATYVLDPKAG